MPTSTFAGPNDYATFESFYEPGASLGPATWILAAIAAVVVGVSVILSQGAATPIAAAVGTWIGGLVGLHGIAATSYGLALLGGGALSIGGMGQVGGCALLEAAFNFSTKVTGDFAIQNVTYYFQTKQFFDDSRTMIKLPLPRSASGSAPYKNAFEIWKRIDGNKPLDTGENAKKLQYAIAELKVGTASLNSAELSRVEAASALLYLELNDYPNAKGAALRSMAFAKTADVSYTLPAYIFALCVFSEQKPDIDSAINFYFKPAILGEPNNKLIPLLYAVMLDRFQYRYCDGVATPAQLMLFSLIANDPQVPAAETAASLNIILARTISLIKMEQQFIYGGVRLSNKNTKNISGLQQKLKLRLNKYKSLIDVSEKSILPLLIAQQSSLPPDAAPLIYQAPKLLVQYRLDIPNLDKAITDLTPPKKKFWFW